MTKQVRGYLELASSTKCDILTTGWAGFGVGVASITTRPTGYWLLVTIIRALEIPTANYEQFPERSVSRSRLVCWTSL